MPHKTDIVKARGLNVGDVFAHNLTEVLEKSYDSVDGKFILVVSNGTDPDPENVDSFDIIVVKVDDKFEVVK